MGNLHFLFVLSIPHISYLPTIANNLDNEKHTSRFIKSALLVPLDLSTKSYGEFKELREFTHKDYIDYEAQHYENLVERVMCDHIEENNDDTSKTFLVQLIDSRPSKDSLRNSFFVFNVDKDEDMWYVQ